MEIKTLVDDAMRDVEAREVMFKAVGFAIAITLNRHRGTDMTDMAGDLSR